MKYLVRVLYGICILWYMFMIVITFLFYNAIAILWHFNFKHCRALKMQEEFYDYGQELKPYIDDDGKPSVRAVSYYEYYPNISSWWKGKKERVYIES